MLILDWMKTDVVSVTPDTTLLQCRKLFKEHGVSRLPVLDTDGVVVGLLTVADLAAYLPQNATPLEILEAIDILGEMKAKEVMAVAPETVYYKGTVDQAALLMVEKRLNCLPVVDSDFRLKGFLTEWDIFKALVDVSGAHQSGIDVAFVLENKRGTMREILDQLAADKMRLASVLTTVKDNGMRHAKIRFYSENPADEQRALEKLKSHPGLRYWRCGEEVMLCEK